MQKTILPLVLVLAAAPALAQNSLLFSGRFPFKSLDQPNERTGGSISQLEEFDFSYNTPGPGNYARSLQPASGHHALLGNPANDGNYTKFYQFKTYFEAIQIGGLFVRHADKASVDASKVYFTVRDNVATKDIEVFTNNGTQVHVMRPGDFVRLDCNGNVVFFITADQLDIAAGPPNAGGTSVKGASAMCQDAAGNLYYSPPQGGHWVNGNQIVPTFANDGSIVMIPASAITYNADGTVQSILPNSAQILWEELGVGTHPSGTSVRGMVINAGSFDRTGAPIAVTGVFGKVCGLDLDPNGGTNTAAYADTLGNFPTVPNFVFASDAGSYGGSIWSTNNNGSLATINGVLCGSNTSGLPADGRWLGVQLDVANFQPSLMGLQVIGQIQNAPTVLDMPNMGALLNNTVQPNFEVDCQTVPNTVIFLMAAIGPGSPGQFAPCLRTSTLPFAPLFAPGSSPYTSVLPSPTTLAILFSNPSGYASYIVPNWNTGTFAGLTLVLQAAALSGSSQFQVSNPVLMQVKS